MAEQAVYNKYEAGGRLRLQWELVVDPAARKIMTLEQMLTVLRRAMQPEQLDYDFTDETIQDADQLLIGRSGEATCRSCQGEMVRQRRTVSFYLDDAVENNPDGTVSAAFLWWELAGEDEQLEGWFAELAQALDDAQEDLMLFGRI